MKEFEKELLQDLQGFKKYEKGRIRINTETKYFDYAKNLIPNVPPVKFEVPYQSIGRTIIDAPSIILFGYNDFISQYNNAIKYKTPVQSHIITFPPSTPDRVSSKDLTVLDAIEKDTYELVFNTTWYFDVDSYYHVNNIYQRGDIVLIERFVMVDGTSNFHMYVAETLIHCVEIPLISLMSLAHDNRVEVTYMKIDNNFNPTIMADPPTPPQAAIPLIFIKQSIFGAVKTDSIDPIIFVDPDIYNEFSIDIPIRINMHNITMITSRNFASVNLDFTFNIKIKN